MNLTSNFTGYANEEYNTLMEAVFYLTYFDKITSADFASLQTTHPLRSSRLFWILAVQFTRSTVLRPPTLQAVVQSF
jgi:hypothetical protein